MNFAISATKALQLYSSTLQVVDLALQLADESDGSVVLLLAHQDAVTRSDVSVLEVAVGPARIRGDRNVMAHEPHLGVIALRRKPGNVVLGGRLADTAEDHKSVAVVPGLSRAKLEVILAGAAGDDRGFVARRADGLLRRTSLRTCRSHTERHCENNGRERDPQPLQPCPSANVSQLLPHMPLRMTKQAHQPKAKPARDGRLRRDSVCLNSV